MILGRDREARSVARAPEMKRLAYVDGVRALAALYVVLTHAVLIVAPAHRGGLRSEPARPSWLPPPHFAVAIFIVVSGFCLTLPVVRADGRLKGGVRHFYFKRARRILPPYYAALALTLVLVWTILGQKTGNLWDPSIPVSIAGYVGNALLIQDFVGFWQVSVPFWSIAVECQIYLLFPLLLLCWRRLGALGTVFAAVGLSYVAMIATAFAGSVGPFYFPGLTLHFVGLFVLGMTAAWLAASERSPWINFRNRIPWSLLMVVFGLCAAALSMSGGDIDALAAFIELPIGLFAASLLVAASRPERSGRVRRILGARPLVFVGMFSFSVYLIHAPLLQAEWQYGLRPLHQGSRLSVALLISIGVPLMLAAAYGFFHLFERRFMHPPQRADEPGSVQQPTGGKAEPIPVVAAIETSTA
jgi:peptidoglycan/LPS O-acetylase OafA/YrhL